ncbi:MAG TPA: hypothetical protein VHQ47_03080 [Phycisphaerae bacterium]|jgi:hypothetical protein|nr:hypothetical protein [Phycisphaerae bacterium]
MREEWGSGLSGATQMKVGRWLLATVLAMGIGLSAQAATVTQNGQDVVIHAGKVIVVVKKARKARRHRHKHHRRIRKAVVHTIKTVTPAAPAKPLAPAANLNHANHLR